MIIYNNYILPHIFKCAGTSIRRTLVKYDSQNIKYLSEHDSKYMLDSRAMSWAKDFEMVALVRNPYDFYESLYNYHYNMETINALSSFTERKFKNNIMTNEPKDLTEWLEANLNLPGFFEENPGFFLHFKKDLMDRPNGFMKTWFINKALADLQHQDLVGSLYQLQTKILLRDNNIKIFKIETELKAFLDYIGFLEPSKLLRENITKTKEFKLTQEHRDLIYRKDKALFERFGYEK